MTNPVNSLRHTINTKDINGDSLTIKIRLSDDCKNGHNDFTITADCYKKGKAKTDRNYLYGGCSHDEILKVRPDLKPFVDLHLCDANGIPTYADANCHYRMFNGFNDKSVDHKEFYCSYYRITGDQYDILKGAIEEDHFAFLLVHLGILKEWKRQALEAIKRLEELTGETFEDNSVKSNFKRSEDDLWRIKSLYESGHYNPTKVARRAEERRQAAIDKKLASLKVDYDKTVYKAGLELKLSSLLVNEFGTHKNVIRYGHDKRIVFNWQDGSYNKQWTSSEFDKALELIKKVKEFEGYKVILK